MGFKCCETLHDSYWGDLKPREYINIRGDVRWRHPLVRDMMFCHTCEDQTSPPDTKERRV